MRTFAAIVAVTVFAGTADKASAVLVYSADFSGPSVGFTHTTSNPPAPGPQAVNGPNFTLSYPGSLNTDTTENFFRTDGDSLISSDFGGAHRFESFSIDVSGFTSATIDVVAAFVGTDSFNNSPTEFIQYFYTFDDGADQQFFLFTDDPNGQDLNASTTIDITGVSTLTIGLNAFVDGAGDGFDVSSFTVDATGAAAIPEPTSLAMLSAVVLGAGGARLRRRFARRAA